MIALVAAKSASICFPAPADPVLPAVKEPQKALPRYTDGERAPRSTMLEPILIVGIVEVVAEIGLRHRWATPRRAHGLVTDVADGPDQRFVLGAELRA